MSIPFHQSVEITADEQGRLAKLHRQFISKISGLPEARRNAVIKATAHNVLGDVDPFTRAVAQQMQAVIDINDRIRAARVELEQIERADLSGFRPKDPDFKAHMLARKHDLEEAIKADMASAITLGSDDLQRSRQEAVLQFRSDDAKAAKAKAILTMRDTIRAQAEEREIAVRARALVNSERLLAGRAPLTDEEA